MKILKKSLSVLACLAIIFTMIPFMATEAKATNLKITLDAGHGGHDPGATGARQWGGDDEKNYNLRQTLAAKERLEQYGVTVYLTRSDDTFVVLEDRPLVAYNNGSDAFISIHNNSFTSSSARGCVVFIPNNNYRPIKAKSLAIANAIMKRLMNDVGIPKNTDPYTNTSSSVTYPDGSAADHYRVIRYSKIYGGTITASMIVESCFQSNQSDVQSFLLNSEKVKQTGYAIADGIADYYGLSLQNYKNTVDVSASSSESKDGEAVVFNKTMNKGVDTSLSVSGWSLHSEGISSFQYQVGDGAWKTMAGSFRQDVANAYPSYENCNTLNAFLDTIDISSLPSGTSKVTVRGLTKKNNYYDVAVYNITMIPKPGTTYMSTEKTRFALNEPIKITAKGDAQNAWVGLFGVNENPGDVSSYYWFEMHSGEVTINDLFNDGTANSRASSITEGTYKLVAFVDAGYIIDPNVPQITITLTGKRHVALDNPSSTVSVAVGEAIFVSGWALHPDGLKGFEISIDGGASSAIANSPRSDIFSVYPDYATCCADVNGFAQNVATDSLLVGKHTAVVSAITKTGDKFVVETFEFTLTPAPYDGEITAVENSGVVIDRTGTSPVVLGIGDKLSIDEVVALFDGEYAITDENGEELTSDYVGSGCLIKLYYKGAYYDTATIIVDADLDGDGVASAKDIIRAKKFMNNNALDCYSQAADLDRDGNVTSSDLTLMSGVCIG